MNELLRDAAVTEGLRRFRRYPEYRNSGVEWLGEIPAHWGQKPLVRCTDQSIPIVYGILLPGPHLNEGVPYIGAGDVVPDRLKRSELPCTTEEIAAEYPRSCVKEGELVYAIRGSFGNVEVVPAELDGVNLSRDAARIVPARGVDSHWLCWVLKADSSQGYFDYHGIGTAVTGVNIRDLKRVPVAEPPSGEQQQIAEYLAAKAGVLDALIAKKERLIELLQEKRTALITHAVTKGLDPNAPMKDSGVEWLGNIPAHWEVKPFKYVANFVNGCAFKPAEWGDEGVPIIRIENLNGGGTFNHTTRDVPAKYHATEGDLLFGWSGNRGTSFGPFLWWRPGFHYVNQHIFRVVNYNAPKKWLYWTLRDVTFYVEKQAHGIIGMVHITRGELGKIPVPMMPRSEQEAIADTLDAESQKIDGLITRIHDGIERLMEYRTALISAAVTGKIDVREEAA